MRPARLFKDWHKEGEAEVVLWHAWGQLSDENGGEPCAIVEFPDGSTLTVAADRLRFMDRTPFNFAEAIGEDQF